jgi:hypothetical protein
LQVRIKPGLILLLIAAAVTLIAYLARRERDRFIDTDAQMVALLPRREGVTVFLDIRALRRAGLLNLLQSSKPVQDVDYQQFVRETGFDYTRDIEALAARGNGQQTFLVIRGRFDWTRLREYALHQGGTCNGAFCQSPGTRPGRWASYLRIQSDVVGLAVSGDPADVLLLSPRKVNNAPPVPPDPVWVSLSNSVLPNANGLPLPLRLFALAVQPAQRVVITAGPDRNGRSDFQLNLQAVCPNAAVADTMRTQLEMDTKLLKMELVREHRQPSASDLTGLLTAGVFREVGNTVAGSWPLRRELLNSLQ